MKKIIFILILVLTNFCERAPEYEKLEELRITPKEFAIRTGKPIKTISNVLNGKSSITPEMAVQFEKVLNIPASFWMSKQANYNEYIAREKEKEELTESIEWSKKFPYE